MFIQLEIKKNIAWVTFNRPKALNAINIEMLNELDQTVDVIKENVKVQFVIFTGLGKAFIAGADISEMVNMDELEAKNYGRLGAAVFRKIELLDKVTIALINGYCLGGGNELAMACDFRIASDKAKFGQPEVTLGITPGFSGTSRLPRIVGVTKAKELLFTGKMIDANEALKIGLLTQVVSHDTLQETGFKFIESMDNNSFNALIHIKHAIDEGMEAPLEDAIELETIYFSRCFSHSNQSEAMKAFFEKRKPNYKEE